MILQRSPLSPPSSAMSYPVWLGFRGGKGVASALGVFLALSPAAAGCTFAIFLVIVLLTRYVSLASILGSAFFPLFGLYFAPVRTPIVIAGFLFIPLLIILKHHENIRRLLNGTENRFGKKEGGGMSRIAILGAGAWGTALALSLARRGGHELVSLVPLRRTRRATRRRRGKPSLPPRIHPPRRHRCHLRPAARHLRSRHPSLRHALATSPRHHHPHRSPAHQKPDRPQRQQRHRGNHLPPHVAGRRRGRQQSLRSPQRSHPSPRRSPPACPLPSSSLPHHPPVAQIIQREFTSPTLRVYTNDDVPGVELGGALKNVIALAAGVATGLNLGHNSSAALITRGIAEMTRLAVACGGRRQTLSGLSGVGDLVLTCTGSLSRNRAVGIELGRGRQLPDILARPHGKVAEGVRSTAAALGLAARYAVEMPITEQMDAILHRNKSPKEAIRELMSRPGRDE